MIKIGFVVPLKKKTVDALVQVAIRSLVASNSPTSFSRDSDELRLDFMQLVFHISSCKMGASINSHVLRSFENGDPLAVECVKRSDGSAVVEYLEEKEHVTLFDHDEDVS